MTPSVFVLGYCSSFAAALAMDRHHQQVFGHRAYTTDKIAARFASCALLICAFCSATLWRSASIGAVVFVVAASLGALLAAVLLALAPRVAAAVAILAGPIAIFETIFSAM
ncbi:hypothetical protein MSC49_36810 (plasmid) [Methylosinus sp. C49]|uniref:DUF3325 family protein n=1 Tax=Methylosinus sp. C49 TaxID=2699395 RepID=UPI001366BEA6|nr:DUF3325 family protein [Methylosinus sp. C49]BBU63746.1 hypothetical protein MSC49_36810 [Methylosinus sp. C49]